MNITLKQRRLQGGVTLIQCAMAIVILVIGTIVIIKIIQLCNRWLPPPPSKPPPEQTNNPPPVSIAAYIPIGTYSSPSGFVPDGRGETSLVSTNCDCSCPHDVGYTITESEQGPVLVMEAFRPSLLVSSNEFMEGLSPLGLEVASPFTTYYGSNGVPANTVSIGYDAGVLSVGHEEMINLHKVVVERSYDLSTWVSILTNISSSSQYPVLTDGTASCVSNAFYRGRIELP